MAAFHALQDHIVAGLQRQMQMWHHPHFRSQNIGGWQFVGVDTTEGQKFEKTTIQPETLGQAARISGVTPADLALLSVWIERPIR